MITLLHTLSVTEVADTLHHCVETILVEDKTPISSFNWSNAAIAFLGTLAGVLALFPTWWTFAEQKKVARNTQLLDADVQYGVMLDLVRHLYRNLVVMWAIAIKMRADKYKTYPSEIHLTKAKISLQDIHLELFAHDKATYGDMNYLVLLLRNYNLEIDVAMKHFAQDLKEPQIKEYDIHTLLLKPGLLADTIITTMLQSFPDKREEILSDARERIVQSHINNAKWNANCRKWEGEFKTYANEKDFFLKHIFADHKEEFFEIFNSDALIECGFNSQDMVKVLMIKL